MLQRQHAGRSAARCQEQEPRTDPNHEDEQLLFRNSHTIEQYIGDDEDGEFTFDKQRQQQQQQ
jgi:hypothetical protein